MKSSFASGAVLALSFAALSPVQATTYTGPGVTDGGAAGDGGAISSVVVTNDASSISFTINSTANMASYIFFAVEIMDANSGTGSTSLVNPWGPHMGISTGMTALIDTWGTGASALTYSAGSWTQNASGAYASGGSGSTFATMTFSLASLGLSLGDSFNFDVVSSYTGGTAGQSAYGALDNTGYLAESDNSYQPWSGANFYDSATASGSTYGSTIYTIQAVPEPASAAFLGLGLLLMSRRLLRRH